MAMPADTRPFFHSFIRLHVLYHAAKDAVFGAEIAEELERHGYRISQGTLYPTLHQLEQMGYLNSRIEFVSGRKRRYYRATAEGKRLLIVARDRLRELVSEVLEDHDAPFRDIRKKHYSPKRRGRS